MVKYLTILIVGLGLVACNQDEPIPVVEKPSSPILSIASDTQALPLLHIQPAIYALGDIKEGEAAIATFLVRNNTEQTITLTDIQASCGCTAAEPDSYVIKAGEFTQLKVAVDTTAKQNNIKKSVFITDSLGNKAEAKLTFNVVANPHLKMKNQSKGIFDGQCASCHFAPLVGINDPEKLYDVGCAMCHGAKGEGAYAPSLRNRLTLPSLQHAIAHGVGKVQMPGFAEVNGGPLTFEQVTKLAAWLNSPATIAP